MNYSEFVKSVKRVNQRMVDISRIYGKESTAYNEYASKMQAMFPDNLNVNKRGEIQLSRSIKTFSNENMNENMKDLEKIKTVGQRKKLARESLKKDGNKKPTKNEIKEMMLIQDSVQEQIDDVLTRFYSFSSGGGNDNINRAFEILHSNRKKSYVELRQAINILENEMKVDNETILNDFGE